MEQNLYQFLLENDLIEPVAEQIRNGSFKLTDEGTIQIGTRREPERPWQLFNPDTARKCYRWHDIYFRYYRIIPKGCRCCWKVVHKMRSVAELFALVKEMKGMGLNGKCGVDGRTDYGNFLVPVAFWYAPLDGGLKAGRSLFKQIHDHLKAHYGNEDFYLVLKRGCTEFEAFLPSDQWDKSAEYFDFKEGLLDQIIDMPAPARNEIEMQVLRTHKRWLEMRAMVGDVTVAAFNGGRMLHPPTVYYHASEHDPKDYPGLGERPLIEGVD